jgi:hypothetical protein
MSSGSLAASIRARTFANSVGRDASLSLSVRASGSMAIIAVVAVVFHRPVRRGEHAAVPSLTGSSRKRKRNVFSCPSGDGVNIQILAC